MQLFEQKKFNFFFKIIFTYLRKHTYYLIHTYYLKSQTIAFFNLNIDLIGLFQAMHKFLWI